MPFASLPWVSLPGGFCPCAHRHSAAIEIPILQLRESCICTHNLAQVAGLNVMLDAVMRDRARPTCAEPAQCGSHAHGTRAHAQLCKALLSACSFSAARPSVDIRRRI